MATIKCPKCGGELVQTTPEIAKCKKCGTAFKRKGAVKQVSDKKKDTVQTNKPKKKHGILKKAIIAVVALGILGSIFGNDDENKSENESKNNSVWAEKDTNLDDFEYYVDGDKVHITDYEGEDKKIKISSSYDIDGLNANVESVSGAPFIFGDLESIIVSEGIENLDATVFNSCEAKYIFIPSTIKNIDDKFWGYFREVEKLYYGGTQEQWNEICKVAREDLDCKFIYCNVKVEELGEDDSQKDRASMQSREDIEAQEEAKREEERKERESQKSKDKDEKTKPKEKSKESNKELSESDYKKKCKSLDYESIMRNPDKYDGKYCVLSGTVDQVIEGWFGSYTIAVLDSDGNKWGCVYSYKENESHVLEGDGVKMYGMCRGTDTTETILGKQITLPRIDVEYIK